MIIKIIEDKSELEGTAYVEVLPGKYSGHCWSSESVFFNEESFGYMEKIISRHVDGYDHYTFMSVDNPVWVIIISELEALVSIVKSADSVEEFADRVFFFFRSSKQEFSANFRENVAQLLTMLERFIAWLRSKLSDHQTISILGL